MLVVVCGWWWCVVGRCCVSFSNHVQISFLFFSFLSFRLSGWDHFAYRSYYIPMRGVVDGSLCEMYFDLSLESQTNIANSMERQVDEIKKKIEDQRQRAL